MIKFHIFFIYIYLTLVVVFSAGVEISSCPKKYKRHLNGNKAKPTLLYSFPGAGNTWTRLLIEYSTGVYSGSVYSDMKLASVLPGEVECSRHVSVVKAHPHTHSAQDLLYGTFESDFNKCSRGHVNKFDKVILLIRDPFDSIWSEYQRRLSNNHVGFISKNKFDWVRWIVNAGYLSYQYLEMWEKHHAYIFQKLPKDNILLLKYEDLKGKNTRRESLRRLVDFLNISDVVTKGGGDSVVVNGVKYSPSYVATMTEGQVKPTKTTDEQIDCAFVLAVSRSVKRDSVSGSGSEVMRKEDAYVQDIACRMWNLFGEHAEKYGYSSFGKGNDKFDCSGYSVIEDFNLGFSNTDYNRLMSGVKSQLGSEWVHNISEHKNGLAVAKNLKDHASDANVDSNAHSNNAGLDLSVFDYRGKSKAYSIGEMNIQSIVSPGGGWVPKFHKNLTWTDKMTLINKRLAIQAVEGVGSRQSTSATAAHTGRKGDMMSRLKTQSKSKF